MGVTHSTHGATPGLESTLKERLHLFKRQATTGDTPFHRAVRSSSNGAAARRRLEGLCEAALQHHAELLGHLEDGARVPMAAARPHHSWAQLCVGGGLLSHADEAEVRAISSSADPADLLRALLDLQNHRGQTALHLAVELGQPEAVEFLLAQGANPWLTDRMGNHMPIHVACLRARVACVKLLLDDLPARWRRSPENESISYLEAPTVSGFTPLHCAVASNDVLCIRAVLAHHPRLQAASRYDSWEFQLDYPRGTTPLHVAACKPSQDAAKELLRYYNNMVLASRGRLHPIPSPSVFGGHMPDLAPRNAPPPPDPRLASNAAQQLPWQVAYAHHLRALAELLHPSMPLAHYFPAPAVGTLQALAAAALRQHLATSLDAAQQVDEARQRRRRLATRRQLQQQQQREEEQQPEMPPALQRCRSSGGGSSSAAADECGGAVGRPAPRSAPVGAGTAAAAGCSRRSHDGCTGVTATELALAALTLPAGAPPARAQAPTPVQGTRLAVALAQLPRAPCVPAAAPPPPLPMPNKAQAEGDDDEEEDAEVHRRRSHEHCAAASFADHPPYQLCGASSVHHSGEEGEHAPSPWGSVVPVEFKAAVEGRMSFAEEEVHALVVEEEDEEGEMVECAVCLDAEARMRVVPCRHCLCAACSRELVRAMGARPLGCPLCRTNVQGFALAAAGAARRQA